MSSFFSKAKQDALHGNYLVRLFYLNIGLYLIILLLNIVLFLATGDTHAMKSIAGRWLALPPDPIDLLLRPWTPLTYMFLHFDFGHILFNMLILYFSGTMVMQYLGERRMLALYIYGGLAGGFLFLILANLSPILSTNTPLVGASAGIMALLIAGALYMPNMPVRLWGIIELKYWMLAAGFVLMDLLNIANGSDNIGGRIAHLGGAIVAYFFIQSMQKGHEWNVYLFQVIDAVRGVLQPKKRASKRGFSFGERSYTSGNRQSSGAARGTSNKSRATAKDADETRLNEILDKIKAHGYDKLSKEEKAFLFNQSQK